MKLVRLFRFANTARLATWLIALWKLFKHPQTPRAAKVVAILVLGYALSPIDLIPDFIPVLGYLDDLILIPLGVLLVRRLIPADVLADCRGRAAALDAKPQSWGGAAIVVGIWLVLAGLGVLLAVRWFS